MRLAILLSVIALGLSTAAVAQSSVAESGRKILESNKGAVVTVRLVIKMRFSMPGRGSEDQESRAEVTGTVIDPSGVTVVALSSTDPSTMYENMGFGGDEDGGFKVTSDLTDVKIMLQDNTEIPAQIVLRDKDLDLAFLRPTKAPESPMQAVDLSQSGSPLILDEIVLLNRLGRVASRTYAATLDRIEAIVERPRTLYVPSSSENNAEFGSPAFTVDGKVVGIALLRTIKGGDEGFGRDDSMTAIILPAGDVLEHLDEAKSAKPEEPTPLPPAEEASEPAEGDVNPDDAPADGNGASKREE